MLHSAVLNVMIKAARRAGRSLKRDLGEVEKLQVSLKGPRNFVTAADRRAEEIVLRGTGQGAAGLRLSRRGRRRARRHRQEPPLDRRSARRHHQFPARHPAFRGFDRARARRRDRRRPDLQSGQRGAVRRRARQGRVPQRPAHPRRRAASGLADAVVGLRPAALRPRRSALARHEIAAAQQNFAGLRRYGAADARSRLGRRRPARRLLGARPVALGHGGRHHPGARGRRIRQRYRRRRRHLRQGRRSSPATTPCTASCCACSRRPARQRQRQAKDGSIAPP